MSLSANAAWEVRPTNGSDNNAGFFAVATPTYATDLATTNGNAAAPVVTSASYNFVAGDVNQYLYVKAGTNWLPGLYQIAVVSNNAATLSQAVATQATPGGNATWSVDYSQQGNSQFNGTNLTVDHTTNTDVAPDGHTPANADIGNGINITAGSGFTTGIYQINQIVSGKWRLDRSPAAIDTASGTWALGGAKQTIPSVMTAWSGNGACGNKCFVKAEATIVTTANIALFSSPQVNSGNGVSSTVLANRLLGYTSTRGDNGQVTVQLSTNSSLSAFSTGSNVWWIENFIIDCNSLTTSTGITWEDGSPLGSLVRNCVIKKFTSAGISSASGTGITVQDCEITAGTWAATGGLNLGAGAHVLRCWIHDNATIGLIIGSSGCSVQCLITNNTGVNSDGIQLGSFTQTIPIVNNTIYQNGRHGIFQNTGNIGGLLGCRNNILVKNGGYGIKGASSAGLTALQVFDGNAYWLNTSNPRNNMDDGAVGTIPTNFVNLIAPYTNTLDVILTGDPFVNAAGNDFTLNNTVGAGMSCRATGTPGPFLNNSKVGYTDMGCFQHLDIGGGAGGFLINPALVGGVRILRPR